MTPHNFLLSSLKVFSLSLADTALSLTTAHIRILTLALTLILTLILTFTLVLVFPSLLVSLLVSLIVPLFDLMCVCERESVCLFVCV